ncbi:hypothetical protein CEUSTIGMA_g4056.t1 [Chlamydomonas eustigma]|uniref:Uncharacterized protein n=1 Tax=Chlamydomonas eustigma TaxID=1157962 RepID=A0A250X1K1_9CHLO|nr:hypothetical protein CEUSTIGMA_g4056.t1 [Chlamydomonas eustigma]|eukprot:GAX76610.1 hypothetical protein CEUSTIGMA_g4056.t1 [Chlamydomonas eustigma]
MEEISASEEFLLKEIHRQQQNVAQHIEDSLIIGFSTNTGRLRAQSAHVKEQGHTVPLEVLETLVKVSDSLNMEHAAFEHRKALKMDEISKKQEEGTSALTAAVAEEKVMEDVQADVVPEALPAMMLNQEMTARSMQHLSGSAAELISAGLPNVLQKRPPKKLWGNLPGLSALQPPPGSSLSRLQREAEGWQAY